MEVSEDINQSDVMCVRSKENTVKGEQAQQICQLAVAVPLLCLLGSSWLTEKNREASFLWLQE